MVNSDRTDMLRHALERPLLGLNMYAVIWRIAAFITTLFTDQVEQDHRCISIASGATLAAEHNSPVEIGDYVYYLKRRFYRI